MSRRGADLGHVAPHDVVAPLRHEGHVLAPPFGIEAEAQHADAEALGDVAHLPQMAVGLGACLVEIAQRCARQLELAAGLERDRGCAIEQPDHRLAVEHRRPAALRLDTLQQGADAVGPS